MLSILIPTYNYDITKLVKEINDQLRLQNIDFEILCYDDNSTNLDLVEKNKSITKLEKTHYKILPNNIGRSAIRNLLAKEAKFSWLLFLDADVLPKDKKFIKNYINHISNSSQIIYGGILYQENQPKPKQLLRWIYGKKREALNYNERSKNTYLSFLTLNFMIHKSVFNQVSFNEDIPNLRHEDTLFSYELMTKNINIEHINNATYHLGIESSSVFLKKSKESLDVLNLFLKDKLLPPNYTKITRVFFKLRTIKFNYLLSFIYLCFRSFMEKHLLSKSPSMLLFDFYRLSYFCHINLKK